MSAITENKIPVQDAAASDPRMQDALDRFRKVPFLLSFELGRGKLKIRDLLTLSSGSVVELHRPAGADLDIRVNETIFGKGEPQIHHNIVGIKINEVFDDFV
jgi:flagellar motor switch protein FliN/FliY